MEGKGEEEEEEGWDVLEDVSLLGVGFEDWPQPARTINRAREAARAPAIFNAFPAFTVSSLLEVKRNITGQAGSFNKREKGRPLRRTQKSRSFIPL